MARLGRGLPVALLTGALLLTGCGGGSDGDSGGDTGKKAPVSSAEPVAEKAAEVPAEPAATSAKPAGGGADREEPTVAEVEKDFRAAVRGTEGRLRFMEMPGERQDCAVTAVIPLSQKPKGAVDIQRIADRLVERGWSRGGSGKKPHIAEGIASMVLEQGVWAVTLASGPVPDGAEAKAGGEYAIALDAIGGCGDPDRKASGKSGTSGKTAKKSGGQAPAKSAKGTKSR
ncbi:hypothetical protein ABT354_04060 [Streptomyces sp. NPDC000594]|uniref:hypothetical protein n=1 Tax=Streptomyces sp. NPDC000594 TaxID=3154261 RepID=UPI003331BF69